MTTSQDLFTLVVNELHLTQEDLNLFTEPNVIHRRYCKHVVRTMNKMQFGLIKTVAEFPPNTRTVAQMQNILIAFLEVVNVRLCFANATPSLTKTPKNSLFEPQKLGS